MREIDTAWLEATIAWAVCASIHREYARNRDPCFNTRQADFVKHEADARAHLRKEVVGTVAKKKKAAKAVKAAKKKKKK